MIVASGCGEAVSASGCSFRFPVRVGAPGVMELTNLASFPCKD